MRPVFTIIHRNCRWPIILKQFIVIIIFIYLEAKENLDVIVHVNTGVSNLWIGLAIMTILVLTALLFLIY